MDLVLGVPKDFALSREQLPEEQLELVRPLDDLFRRVSKIGGNGSSGVRCLRRSLKNAAISAGAALLRHAKQIAGLVKPRVSVSQGLKAISRFLQTRG
jgi:hypothetical protein